jgi:hypothetical protein
MEIGELRVDVGMAKCRDSVWIGGEKMKSVWKGKGLGCTPKGREGSKSIMAHPFIPLHIRTTGGWTGT